MSRPGARMRRRPVALVIAVSVSTVLLALGATAGAAPAKRSDTVKISLLITNNSKPGWDLVIPNFERVYPNIDVDVDYVGNNATLWQVETTELAAGNAPELLTASPGCGTPIAICVLAKAGYLAPMVKKPWASKARSLPLVKSKVKFGQALYGFIPQVAPFGVFTNDSMFKRLGLKVPQTYAELLGVCREAKAAGTSAMVLAGNAQTAATLTQGLVVPMLYATDKQWTRKLKAGKATFSGSPAWRRGLQRFEDMNDAGCFQPGAVGVTSGTTAAVLFAQGQGLMFPMASNNEGTIAAANPQFTYSFRRLPSGDVATETTTAISLLQGISVNAHSSVRNQAAAQSFVDFLARPEQNALFARATGGLTEYQLLKGQVPAFMPSLAKLLTERKYVINPTADWWNGGVILALQQNQVGLMTGQRSVDDVLKAMDAAWKQGPA